jgi:hypothetical protein
MVGYKYVLPPCGATAGATLYSRGARVFCMRSVLPTARAVQEATLRASPRQNKLGHEILCTHRE